jgi:APA family basic amino acid/polyamine antiporter
MSDADGGAAASARPRRAAARAERSLGAAGVALFLFSAVAGGPYGIETAVQAAGALPTFCALAVLSVSFCATQALVVAELSARRPTNAGCITWVLEGLGPAAGFAAAWVSMAQAAANMPLYAVLTANALAQAAPALRAPAAAAAVKAGAVAFALGVNVAGVAAAGRVAGVMVALVQTPFVLMPLLWAAAGRRFEWRALARAQPGWWPARAGVFVATVAWNMQGWLALGAVAGEVRAPRRSIPRGVAAAVALVLANYVWPLLLTVPLAPDADEWGSGFFVAIAERAAPALGAWAAAAAALSCAANFLPVLAAAARQTQAAARARMALPRACARDATRFRTPVPALAGNAALALALALAFDFDTLVTLQLLLAVAQLLLVLAAFVALKARGGGGGGGGAFPAAAAAATTDDDAAAADDDDADADADADADDVYAVPGGLPGALAVCAPILAVAVVVVAANAEDAWVALAALAAAGVALAAAGALWERWVYSPEILRGLVEGGEDADAEDADGAEGGADGGDGGGSSGPAQAGAPGRDESEDAPLVR